MASQYLVEQQLSAKPESWVGIENTMKKESNCNCVYISSFHNDLSMWILNTRGIINFRKRKVKDGFFLAGSDSSLEDFFAKGVRRFGILPEDECEDR